MIDNVVNMIEGLKNKVDMEVLLANIDPLGWFPEIKNIKVLEGDDYTSLYRDVLIDTPIGSYFMKFLEESIENLHENRTLNDIQNLFKEMKPEYIRTSLKKMWLEDFFVFAEAELNETSKAVMIDLLRFEADFKTVQVIYNSIGNRDLNTAARIITTRKNLCPTIGYLYPDCERMYLQAMTLDTLRDAIKGIDNYREILKDAPDPLKREDFNVSTRTLDDIMYDDECRRYSLAFDG
jgi:V-type H+-transporting ATPase subunit d